MEGIRTEDLIGPYFLYRADTTFFCISSAIHLQQGKLEMQIPLKPPPFLSDFEGNVWTFKTQVQKCNI